MSIASSIMNMFNPAGGATIADGRGTINPTPPAQANSNLPASQAAAQLPHQAVPGQMPNTSVTAQSGRTDANGAVPADGTNGAPKAPLADFANMWDPPTPVLDASGKPVAPSNVSYINIDPKKIMEAAKQTNFANFIPQELMQKIAKGGQEGIQATMEAMNIVGQTAFGQSATAAAKMTENALNRAREDFAGQIPELIRRATAGYELRGEDARFNNPAVKPVIAALQTQFSQKFPQATPAEITAYVKSYMGDLAQVFAPAAPAPTPQKGSRNVETDWDSLIFNTQQ